MSIWYKIGAVGVLIAALIGWHTLDKRNAVNKAVEATVASYQARVNLEVIKAKEVETALLNSALASLKEKNERIKNIDAKLSSALNSLSKRPSRSEYNPSASQVGKTCTGAELLREDGEFLAREAARADQLIIERDYYYAEYERAREALAAHKGANG